MALKQSAQPTSPVILHRSCTETNGRLYASCDGVTFAVTETSPVSLVHLVGQVMSAMQIAGAPIPDVHGFAAALEVSLGGILLPSGGGEAAVDAKPPAPLIPDAPEAAVASHPEGFRKIRDRDTLRIWELSDQGLSRKEIQARTGFDRAKIYAAVYTRAHPYVSKKTGLYPGSRTAPDTKRIWELSDAGLTPKEIHARTGFDLTKIYSAKHARTHPYTGTAARH
jgi:uncharacterized protein YjiS (DUF1127 family)